MLDKESQVPLHYQIYTDILEKIKNKEYKENDKLPSEVELQELYGVSRITVRRAMQDLQKDGYAIKYRGIGTLVSKPKRSFNIQNLSSFSEDNEKYGEASSSILLNFGEVIPEDNIKEMLELEKNEKAYLIERIRLSGNMIIGLHKAYIRKTENIVLKEEDFQANGSLYNMLKEQGVVLDHALETLEAKLPNQELCKVLKIDQMTPIFYKERKTYDVNNKPIEYVKMYYRADMYQYRAVLDLNKK